MPQSFNSSVARTLESKQHNHENSLRDHGAGTGQVLACLIPKKNLYMTDFITSTKQNASNSNNNKVKKHSK